MTGYLLRVMVQAFAALSLCAGSAAARDPVIPRSELPGIGSADPRRVVESSTVPWLALGRVQTELGDRCTGTLIGPRTVLTAAHCLVAFRSERLVQPASVHFLLGYRLGAYAAHARVVAYKIGPGFDAATQGPRGADWAVLTLDTEIGKAGRWLPLLPEAARPQTLLVLGGYQQDRPELLMADSNCRVLGLGQREGRPMLVHDCAGTRGVSGSPLLVLRPDGSWAVAGIAVAASRGQAQGVAVPSAVVLEELRPRE